jgi:hypothetical protein
MISSWRLRSMARSCHVSRGFVTIILVLGLLVSLFFTVVGALSYNSYADYALLLALFLTTTLVVRRVRLGRRGK